MAAVSSTHTATKSAIRRPGKFGFILEHTKDEQSAKTMKIAATTRIAVLCPVESELSTRARYQVGTGPLPGPPARQRPDALAEARRRDVRAMHRRPTFGLPQPSGTIGEPTLLRLERGAELGELTLAALERGLGFPNLGLARLEDRGAVVDL